MLESSEKRASSVFPERLGGSILKALGFAAHSKKIYPQSKKRKVQVMDKFSKKQQTLIFLLLTCKIFEAA